MRKEILILFLPAVVGGLLFTGCASSKSSTQAKSKPATSEPVDKRVDVPQHEASVRQPPSADYPCGEVLIREPTIQPKRELVNKGNPEEEHVWVPGYWGHIGYDWVWIPAHQEGGMRRVPPPVVATNAPVAM